MASVINMPKLSPTMEEGVLAKWTKQEGDAISPGDVIAEVETDKANMDFPLEDEGVLLKLLVGEGETVKLGAPVAILGEAGEDPSALLAELGAAAAPRPQVARAEAGPGSSTAPGPVAAAARAPTTPEAPPAAAQGRIKASPLARKLAEQRGVNLRALAGTGPAGRIVKRDVLSAAASPGAAGAATPPPSREDRLVPASQMRKAIARRLVEAKREIPHIYLVGEASVDRLFDLRAQLGELGATKVSVNDLVVKALALALGRVPEANASWTAEGILHHGRVDVGVAVSLPDGLITPVVRGADHKPIAALSAEVKALAERARNKKLKPEEFSGGSATVTNLGMYGVREFSAIINPPEAVILAVGATEKRPVVVERGGHDQVTIVRRMTLTLSCDHRVVDGVLGARLLGEVIRFLENPIGMIL